MQAFLLLKRMKRSHYIFRKKRYRKRRRKFDLLDCLSEDSDNYNNEEFLYNFRLSRESFLLLLEEMETKRAFIDTLKYEKQRPIAYQLLVFLYRIGREGSAGGSLAVSSYFGIGKGSVNTYVRRCVEALHEIKDEVIYWPDQEERNDMRSRLSAYGFRCCVGIIDGTLIVLEFKPEKFHECYYSCKSCYAINVMVVCDNQKRITYYNAGWPGSTHDNHVFRSRFKKPHPISFQLLVFLYPLIGKITGPNLGPNTCSGRRDFTPPNFCPILVTSTEMKSAPIETYLVIFSACSELILFLSYGHISRKVGKSAEYRSNFYVKSFNNINYYI
jgi:hypothetical protein